MGEVKAPPWLQGRALEAWGAISAVLEPMGLLTTADPHALALLCDAYAEYIDCRAQVKKLGRTYKVRTKTGEMLMTRPEVGMASDAWRRVLRMMTEFGLTPSSRAKIHAAPQTEADPFEDFMSGRAN